MRPFKVSLPFGWLGESGADPTSQTIARSYPGYGRAPPETKDGHPSSLAYSSAIRLNAKIRPPSTYSSRSLGRDDGGGDPLARLGSSRAQDAPPGINRDIAQLFLDADELIVFRDAIGPRKRACLDLTGIRGNRDVGDGRILGLARAV